jgi:hypothetical protein
MVLNNLRGIKFRRYNATNVNVGVVGAVENVEFRERRPAFGALGDKPARLAAVPRNWWSRRPIKLRSDPLSGYGRDHAKLR